MSGQINSVIKLIMFFEKHIFGGPRRMIHILEYTIKWEKIISCFGPRLNLKMLTPQNQLTPFKGKQFMGFFHPRYII